MNGCPDPRFARIVRPAAATGRPRCRRFACSSTFHSRRRQPGFTLVELLVVIAIIGILVALLLPAVQSARESARRAQCYNNLTQLILAVNNYEMAFGVYPPGTVADAGPIQSRPQGYHHSWLTQILPYIEQRNAYARINRDFSVYHPANQPVRVLGISVLSCPSMVGGGRGYSTYAGVHHDVESPIDETNHGVFFLNSRVGYDDVSDGSSQTLFIGEKHVLLGDLGWMSGTRATLRNTGTSLNAEIPRGDPWGSRRQYPSSPPGEEQEFLDGAMMGAMGMGGLEEMPGGEAAEPTEQEASAGEPLDAEPQDAAGDPTRNPVYVGGFSSVHPGGANFALGDGSVRYLSETMDRKVYQQLGHRADGQLLDEF